jgi:hypothetical protein
MKLSTNNFSAAVPKLEYDFIAQVDDLFFK